MSDTQIEFDFALAGAFVACLRAEVGDAGINQIRERNAAPDYAGDIAAPGTVTGNMGFCASHDFCDANVPMLEAFKAVHGRDPAILSNGSSDAENAADCERWGRAWSIAKRLWLTAPERVEAGDGPEEECYWPGDADHGDRPAATMLEPSLFDAYCGANPDHVAMMTQGELADLRSEFEDKEERRAPIAEAEED